MVQTGPILAKGEYIFVNGNGRRRSLQERWATESRWKGIERRYGADDVKRLQGSVVVEHTLARMGVAAAVALISTPTSP